MFLFFLSLSLFTVGGEVHYHPTLTVTAPHLSYTCPAGANISIPCAIGGGSMYSGDQIRLGWLFNPQLAQRCHNKNNRPRVLASTNHSHAPAEGVHYGERKGSFWVTLVNVTHADQGRYCCVALDIHKEGHHTIVEQRPHSHVLLTITPRKNATTPDPVCDTPLSTNTSP